VPIGGHDSLGDEHADQDQNDGEGHPRKPGPDDRGGRSFHRWRRTARPRVGTRRVRAARSQAGRVVSPSAAAARTAMTAGKRAILPTHSTIIVTLGAISVRWRSSYGSPFSEITSGSWLSGEDRRPDRKPVQSMRAIRRDPAALRGATPYRRRSSNRVRLSPDRLCEPQCALTLPRHAERDQLSHRALFPRHADHAPLAFSPRHGRIRASRSSVRI